MATHSSILAWRIPWTEEPGGLWSMGFLRLEYCSGLLFPSPGDLLNSGIKSGSLAFQVDSLLAEPPKGIIKRFLLPLHFLPVVGTAATELGNLNALGIIGSQDASGQMAALNC